MKGMGIFVKNHQQLTSEGNGNLRQTIVIVIIFSGSRMFTLHALLWQSSV